MAIKKNELYSSLWASCDKLRGGMDASQYKDYILTLLFVKYVTDKFKGVKYADITVPEGGSFDDLVALKGNKNIGEEMDKVIAKLAEAGENNLRGVIDNAHFNDEAKLGSGKEMVDKLTGLIAIFQRDEFNFKKNKASGDDILGDAYEYLMRHFATESGKSKGQFYSLVFSGDKAILTVRKESAAKQREAFVNEWYREQLKREVAKYLPKWEKITGLYCSGWQSKYMTTKWGTCNTNTRKIWLNLQLAKKPIECLEYVILHELAHLKVKNHGPEFVAVLDQHMPQWQERKKLLNESKLDYMDSSFEK